MSVFFLFLFLCTLGVSDEEDQKPVRLPLKVAVELQPRSNHSWARVQSLAHNPRLRSVLIGQCPSPCLGQPIYSVIVTLTRQGLNPFVLSDLFCRMVVELHRKVSSLIEFLKQKWAVQDQRIVSFFS